MNLISGNTKETMKAVDAKSRDLYMVPVPELTILPEFNTRTKNDEYDSKVREIADSIKANGFYSHKPFAVIVIKVDGKSVVAVYDGHTRYDGLMLAISEGAVVERVPAVVAPAGTTLEDITVGLVTNNSGRQLDPMGIAVVVKRLVGYGLEVSEIAKRIGFTPAYVGGLLSLVGAPKPIRDMVNAGTVSASLAVNTLRDEGENAIAVLEAGLVKAKAAGKSKVTKKSIVPTVAPKFSNDPIVVRLGLSWIKENGGDDKSFEMLSAITGMSTDELKAM